MPLATSWDSELLKRYTFNQPTVTYPPLETFHPVDPEQIFAAFNRSRQALTPLSLYVHLPFCASRCHHCQRHSLALVEPETLDTYLDALQQEILLTARELDARQHVERLHLGGGTPTLLSHAQLNRLANCLQQHFTLIEHAADYSVEIDPRQTNWPTMGLLREFGFNRIQLRVHDLAQPVQAAINRAPTAKGVQALIEAARTLQFKTIGIELIYGLPAQTPQSFAQTLKTIIALAPDRLTLKPFSLSHTLNRKLRDEDIPSFEQQLLIRQLSFESLSAAGYIHLGLEHYALADDDLVFAQEDGNLRFDRNGYSTYSPCDSVGLGVNAISHIAGLYMQNTSDLTHYQALLQNNQWPRDQGLMSSHDEQLRAFIIEQLQCQQRLDIKAIEQNFSICFEEYFAPICERLKNMMQEHILYWDKQEIRLLDLGRGLIAPICGLFAQL